MTAAYSGLILWANQEPNVPFCTLTAWTRGSLCEGPGRRTGPHVPLFENVGSGVGHVALLVFVFQHWAEFDDLENASF